MVLKTGYILPAQNYVARMKALEQGLANNNIRNLATIQGQMATKVSVPSTVSPTPTTVFQNPPVVARNVQLQEINATTPLSHPQTPTTPNIMPLVATKIAEHKGDTALIREIKSRLALPTGANFGLKNPQERIEREQMGLQDINIKPTFAEMVVKKSSKNSGRDLSASNQQAEEPAKMLEPTPSDLTTTASLTDLSTTANQNQPVISQDQQNAIDEANKFIGPLDKNTFIELLKELRKIRIAVNLTPDKRKNAQFKVPVYQNSGKPLPKGIGPKSTNTTYEQAWKSYSKDPNMFVQLMKGYIQQEFGASGSGLSGGNLVRAYYHRNAPNFGNLFLNEKELKRGNLSISQPFSKTYILHQKNISPLLKKMILDIANTLEFDKQDYYNLDGEEKRIIEKIIRAQKDMKEYNIKKLIDDDDYKMKKRLQILVGQINAGNESHLVKEEIRQLLKNLFDNRAISLYKYQQSIKSLNAL